MDITVGVVSLGCPKNLVDTEVVLGNLTRQGYKIVNRAENADVIIVNTCGFIDKAKQESINTILEMAEYRIKGRCRALMVIGCLAERYKEDIYKEIPEVDAVVGIGQYPEIHEVIRTLASHESREEPHLIIDDYIHRLRSTPNHLSYLKISDGCDNMCTYCVIPSIRGRYRSRQMEDILDEARHLANHGVRELVLVAQDSTRYGFDLYGKTRLAELLKMLCRIDGIEWVRVMYAYPDSITDELVEVMAGEDKICKYIDLPIQHISDEVLKAMGRRCSGSQIRSVIRKLRSNIPDIAIRTSLIVGFPVETESDFHRLLEFVRETEFDRLGVFTYSREEGTPASRLPGQVPYKVKKSRQSSILKVQRQISKKLNQEFIGKTLDVLIEGRAGPNRYFGRSYRDAPEIDGIIYVKSRRELQTGNFESVRITSASQYDLSGGAVNESCQ